MGAIGAGEIPLHRFILLIQLKRSLGLTDFLELNRLTGDLGGRHVRWEFGWGGTSVKQ